MAMGWVGCSGMGARPPNRACGAEIPIGVFPCPWALPSSVSWGKWHDPMGVTRGRPLPSVRAFGGNQGASGEAVWPGRPQEARCL